MQSQVWAALARQLPPEVIDRLMLVTTSGTEIALQSLLRIEQDFLVIKGRLSGSQDAGRVFFVPYTQIDYFGTLHPLKDTEFQEMFGHITFAETEEAPPERPAASLSGISLPAANGSAPGSSPSLPNPGSGTRPIIKSAVLERFRARNGNGSGPPSPREGS